MMTTQPGFFNQPHLLFSAIAFFWVAAIAIWTGLILVIYKAASRRQIYPSFVLNLTVLFAALLSLFLAAEIGMRLSAKIRSGIPFFRPTSYFYDPVRGWAGRKTFGDPEARKFKILITGDSYTAPFGLHPRSAYYQVLKKQGGAEIFAMAAGGYGTLQEYFVIDRYFDSVRPDLVIVQASTNDFLNNHWGLAGEARLNYHGLPQPFLIEGSRVEMRAPKRFGLIGYIALTSRFFFYGVYMPWKKFESRLAKMSWLSTAEKRIEREGLSDPSFRESVIMTETLIKKIKQRIGATPLVVFVSTENQPYLAAFEEIFRRNENIYYITDVYEAVERAEAEGRKMKLADRAHWNAEGHEVAGEALLRALNRLGLLADPGQRTVSASKEIS